MLILLILTTLSLNCFAQNQKIVLNTRNNVLIASGIEVGSMTLAMLRLTEMVIYRGPRKYPLYIVLDSPGGSIYHGDNFIQFAKTIRNLHTITMFSASMAASIAQSLPGKRYITEHGLFMFHRATMSLKGQVGDGEFESRLKNSKIMITRMEQRSADRIGITLQDYRQKVKDEWWISGAASVKYNISDGIVDIHCTPALIRKKINQKVSTMFGTSNVKRSACPLVL